RELVRHGYSVDLIGISERAFTPPAGAGVLCLRPRSGFRKLGLPGAALRMSLTLADLVRVLVRARPKTILVQNPPAFPTFSAGRIAARITGARLIVDWHNYGFSMLALQTRGKVIAWAERYEGRMARHAAAHFCVSRAMREDLKRRFGIEAQTVYDRPLRILPKQQKPAGRDLIVVCPAGWTADEDMDMLVDALELMEPQPGMEIHLTGDGPTREELMPRIEKLRLRGWRIHTGFLAEPEYRELLARADIGISMHRSSSGLDLAMKVVDLQEAGVPVLALNYGGSLPEQVTEGETGWLFCSVEGLAKLLGRLRENPPRLTGRAVSTIWPEEWDHTAAGYFRR
ncbi:MAG TPA: glycosyltransferase, partial [Bryobacteraceae bacterium]|nr:glycosyltransferase [Bryobacteraceae bacterium]